MALVLHYGSGSPFAWRVWLALEAKGVPYELRMISFSDRDHKKPEYLALNPRGKIPVLQDDDFALYESAAIMEYLDERFPAAVALFPGDARQRACIRRLVLEADHYFGPSFDGLWDTLFASKGPWDEDVVARELERFADEIVRWETLLGAPFAAGTDAPTAADFTLYPHLALALRLEKRKPDLAIRRLVGPVLGAWQVRMEALPYFAKTLPPHWKA